MSLSKTLTATAATIVLAVGSGQAFAGNKGKGKSLGQGIAPGQTAAPGQQSAPGQIGVKPAHPATFGAAASNCAHIAAPQLKDNCVRAARNN